MVKRVIKVRNLEIGGIRPVVCVPIVARHEEDLEKQLGLIASAPHDLVEFRADYYENITDEETAERVLSIIRKGIFEEPLLFTYRTKAEGGEGEISFEEYRRLCLWAAGTAGRGLADLVDLELFTCKEEAASLAAELQKRGVRVIGSSHDFEKTPPVDEMVSRLCRMQEAGMDIPKLAVMPRKKTDVTALLHATALMAEQYADRPFITMSMGEMGMPSRFAGAHFGSCLTFASAGHASAPGQMDAEKLSDILKLIYPDRE